MYIILTLTTELTQEVITVIVSNYTARPPEGPRRFVGLDGPDGPET